MLGLNKNIILSIIILNYKSDGLTKYCLKNIFNSKPTFDYEIIVVDNASPERNINKIKEEFNQIKLIKLKENKGFSAGNNAGIKLAQGKYILIINPDVVITPGKLERLVDFLDRNPHIGLAGPQLLNPDGTIQYSCLRFPDWKMPFYRRSPLGKLKRGREYLKYYLMLDFDHRSDIPVEWLFGACLIIRKTALQKVGLFDENYFLYIEDTDLCRRFWEMGFPVYYVASVALIHYHHRESALNPGIGGMFSYITRVHLKDFWYYLKKYKGKKNPKIN